MRPALRLNGTTACKWDVIIPFEPLWEQYKRIVKPNAAIALTASQPFTSQLVMSNPKWFKYEWIWDKARGVGFQVAKFRPMMRHESILIFGKGKTTYNPQMTARSKVKRSKCYTSSLSSPLKYNDEKERIYSEKYPTSIYCCSNASQLDKDHPTQKPVALFEYLIKTYTNEGDLVLDNCAGSGTTAIAALNTNRNYILMEKEQEYIDVITDRLSQPRQLRLIA